MSGKLPIILFVAGLLIYAFSALYPLGVAFSKEVFYLLLAVGSGFCVISGRLQTALLKYQKKKTG
ncbi:hypothetical protein PY093_09485 [Cytobacillus sp. S13-E01]|uniref:hypothetical protein n=1 Tax=Cytobacillus sp. S13-E01 TaxID=3031326 RepID=UPI0023D81C4C|nr:hypothetical protein [Cytobacillus sp. S13-E01]MDF0726947.1 hypothetical protein [Cytobacillus sp. S13-E01]